MLVKLFVSGLKKEFYGASKCHDPLKCLLVMLLFHHHSVWRNMIVFIVLRFRRNGFMWSVWQLDNKYTRELNSVRLMSCSQPNCILLNWTTVFHRGIIMIYVITCTTPSHKYINIHIYKSPIYDPSFGTVNNAADVNKSMLHNWWEIKLLFRFGNVLKINLFIENSRQSNGAILVF